MRSKCASNLAATPASRITIKSLFWAFSPDIKEIRRPRAQQDAVDGVGLQVHERAAALEPHVVGEVAKRHEIMPLTRIEHDPDWDAPTVGGVERVNHSLVGS